MYTYDISKDEFKNTPYLRLKEFLSKKQYPYISDVDKDGRFYYLAESITKIEKALDNNFSKFEELNERVDEEELNGDEHDDDEIKRQYTSLYKERMKIKKKYVDVLDEGINKLRIIRMSYDDYNNTGIFSVNVSLAYKDGVFYSGLDIVLFYDMIRNKISRNNRIYEQLEEILNPALTDEARKKVCRMFSDYFDRAIREAKEDREIFGLSIGWNNHDEYYMKDKITSHQYQDFMNKFTPEHLKRMFEEIKQDKRVFFMVLYEIAAISKEKIKLACQGENDIDICVFTREKLILNLYGTDEKKRNKIANLFFGLRKDIKNPTQMCSRDCISLSSNNYEKSFLWLVSDSVVMIRKKEPFTIKNAIIKRIREDIEFFGKKIKLAILSRNRFVDDTIIAINTDNCTLSDYKGLFDLYFGCVILYIAWMESFNAKKMKKCILEKRNDGVVDLVDIAVEKYQDYFTVDVQEIHYRYLYTIYLVFESFLYDWFEEVYKWRPVFEKYIFDLVVDETDEVYTCLSDLEYLDLFISFFNEDMINSKDGNDYIHHCEDSVENKMYYFVEGQWWLSKYKKKYKVPYNDNQIKKLLHKGGYLGHFVTGNNSRSTFTIQRSLDGQPQKSYYRFEESIVNK